MRLYRLFVMWGWLFENIAAGDTVVGVGKVPEVGRGSAVLVLGLLWGDA